MCSLEDCVVEGLYLQVIVSILVLEGRECDWSYPRDIVEAMCGSSTPALLKSANKDVAGTENASRRSISKRP